MPARDAFSPAEEARLRATLSTFSRRDQALILFGLHTGFRANELRAFTVGHVLNAQGHVRTGVVLERRFIKHGRGPYRRQVRSRAVPLTPLVQAALGAYLAERFAGQEILRHRPLFLSRQNRALSTEQMNAIVARFVAQAGCDPTRRYGTHSLPKTFARRVHERSGHDLQLTRQALGHSSALTTQLYLPIDQPQLRGLLDGLDDGLVLEPHARYAPQRPRPPRSRRSAP